MVVIAFTVVRSRQGINSRRHQIRYTNSNVRSNGRVRRRYVRLRDRYRNVHIPRDVIHHTSLGTVFAVAKGDRIINDAEFANE